MNYPESTLELIQILHKVDHLNSWVRSDSFRHSGGGRLDFVIYHLKSEAIKAAMAAGIASHRLIGTDVRCRDCCGSGRYVNSWGEEFSHCRMCFSTGTVHLQFIESTLAGDLVWHSPANFRLNFLRNWSHMEEHSAGDWKPHTKGRDLTVDQAALLLNEVESYFPGRSSSRTVYEGRYPTGDVDDFASYRLVIGQTDAERCNLCECETDDSGWHHITLGRLEWSANICKACRALHGMGVFKLCARDVPGSLWTPAIKAWVDRHPTAVKPCRK